MRAEISKIAIISSAAIFAIYLGLYGSLSARVKNDDTAVLIQQAQQIADAWRRSGKGQSLFDVHWKDGADDLAPILGALPVPPPSTVFKEYYPHWVPINLSKPAIGSFNGGVGPAPGWPTNGILVYLNRKRPELCREIASAGGKSWRTPQEISRQDDWAKAAGLAPGEFSCVWINIPKKGSLKAGDMTMMIMRVL